MVTKTEATIPAATKFRPLPADKPLDDVGVSIRNAMSYAATLFYVLSFIAIAITYPLVCGWTVPLVGRAVPS